MLKVVGESRRLLRVVLAADLDGDVGLHSRSLLVDGHVDLQPVVQGVDLGLHGIPLDSFVLVLRARSGEEHRDDGRCRQNESSFHIHVTL